MYKLLITAGLSLTLSGCFGQSSPEVDTNKLNFSEVCHDKVVYVIVKQRGKGSYAGYGFMSVKLDTEGKVEVCNKWEK